MVPRLIEPLNTRPAPIHSNSNGKNVLRVVFAISISEDSQLRRSATFNCSVKRLDQWSKVSASGRLEGCDADSASTA